MKATEERLRNGLGVEDVLESIINANATKKILRSRSVGRVEAGERWYVIEARHSRERGSTRRERSAVKVEGRSSTRTCDCRAHRARCRRAHRPPAARVEQRRPGVVAVIGGTR